MADIALLYSEQYKKIKGARQDNNALVPAAVDGKSVVAGIARRTGQAINRGMEKLAIMGSEGAVEPKGLFAFAIVEGCFSS